MTDDPLHADGRPAFALRGAGGPLPGALASVAACAVAAATLGLALGGADSAALALVFFLAGAGVMLAALPQYPHRRFGPANAVTLFRLALVAALAGALWRATGAEPAAAAVVAVAALALVLDGIDGWLARRTGLVSAFGGRFDMEVDCVLALTLSVAALASGKVGAWVLLHGLARYLFWAAALVLPWLAGPLPERWTRKAICVVQIVALIALVSPLVGPALAPPLAAAVLAAVAWSFAADIRTLHRGRR